MNPTKQIAASQSNVTPTATVPRIAVTANNVYQEILEQHLKPPFKVYRHEFDETHRGVLKKTPRGAPPDQSKLKYDNMETVGNTTRL